MADEDDPARTDPTQEDELAARRAREAGSIAAAAENGGDEPPVGEEDDGQFFVWEQGRKVTLGTLIARGTTVEHAFVFGGKRLKGKGGLMGFDEDALVLVRGLIDKVALVPTRDDQERVTKVTVETHVAAKTLVNADSDEAKGLLAPILEKWAAEDAA